MRPLLFLTLNEPVHRSETYRLLGEILHPLPTPAPDTRSAATYLSSNRSNSPRTSETCSGTLPAPGPSTRSGAFGTS
jgi:hypothetical protein